MENEKNEGIKEFGTTRLSDKKSGSGIELFTIIGEIEGHEVLSGSTKATKYEHLLPKLAQAEEDEDVEGILILLNTLGGDVEAGLAIAEMIASLSKPTVSLVLGGSHSIGGPLAVSDRNDDHPSGPVYGHVHRRDPELPEYGENPGPDHPLYRRTFEDIPGAPYGTDA